MESVITKLVEITRNLLDYCLTNEPQSEETKLTEQQAAIKAVYNIILELSTDSLRAIEGRRQVSSGALVRSLFEYHIELLYLAQNPDNWKQRELDAECEQLKLMNCIDRSQDPFFLEYKAKPRFLSGKAELVAATKDHTKNSLFKLCENVGSAVMYDAVYRIVSPDAHPNLNKYGHRYASRAEDGFNYDPSPELPEDDASNRLSLLAQILTGSTYKIHEILPDCDISVIEPTLTKIKGDVLNLVAD